MVFLRSKAGFCSRNTGEFNIRYAISYSSIDNYVPCVEGEKSEPPFSCFSLFFFASLKINFGEISIFFREERERARVFLFFRY